MANNSSFPNCPSDLHDPSFLLLASLSGVSGIMAAVGNAIVLLAIYRTECLNTVSILFIASLAAVDLTVGAFQNPILMARSIKFGYMEYRYDLPEKFDMIEDFLWIYSFLCTSFCLGAISYDRYTAVTKVFRYHVIITRRRGYCVIGSIWFFAISFSSIRFKISEDRLPMLWLATALIACTFPLWVTSYSYLYIFKSAHAQTQFIVNTSPIEERRKIEAAHQRKTAWTIGIIISVFVLLYLPSLVVACIDMFVTEECVIVRARVVAWPWVTFICYISSAVNPWIYSFRFPWFRQALKQTFTCS
ncbi:trace amine-associated receptor 7e [Nematostella vectensis]|uniref:trace amine-associated receptor 7e n=1 Tax=Nematostella vectensis TaxID=45351 RepID=UPI0020774AC9|nr:trace amine-associated receptor 7e [Nematostella vectensis]